MEPRGTFEPNNHWIDADDRGPNEYDEPPRRDPDAYSATLRHYHQGLWSGRELPGRPGHTLQLEPYDYGLIDHSLAGMFGLDEGLYLSSDSAIPTWSTWNDTRELRDTMPGVKERIDAAYWPLYAMGAMLLFPRRRVNGPSINQAKGADYKSAIGDRLDITVECIRRHYAVVAAGLSEDTSSPLGSTLMRYAEFFALFGDFAGYTDFWLLQDLLTPDGRVRFFMEPDVLDYDFATSDPLPRTAEQYRTYLDSAEAFVAARNDRMRQRWNEH